MDLTKLFNTNCKSSPSSNVFIKHECSSTAKNRKKSNSSNPFFIFLNEFREDLKEKEISLRSVTELAKIAGKHWRHMSNHEKLTYYVWARKNKEQKAYLNSKQYQLKRDVEEGLEKFEIKVPAVPISPRKKIFRALESEKIRKKFKMLDSETPSNLLFTYIK